MGLKIRRLVATYIDYSIIFNVCYYLLKYIQSLIIENLFFEIFFLILFILIGLNLFLRKDVIFGYESIGKNLKRLKIYDKNNERLTNKKQLIDRIFHSIWTFHIYIFMILINNKSTGDKKIGTTVK